MSGTAQPLHPSTPLRGQGEGQLNQKRAAQSSFAQKGIISFILSLFFLVSYSLPGLACSPVMATPRAPLNSAERLANWTRLIALLSQTQKKELTELKEKFEALSRQLKPQIESKQQAIELLLKSQNPSPERIHQLINEKLALETQLHKAALESWLALKKVLPPEMFHPCGFTISPPMIQPKGTVIR